MRRVCCGASAPFACAPRAPEPLGSAGAYPSVAARLFRLWWCTLESHLHPLLLLLFKALCVNTARNLFGLGGFASQAASSSF